MPDLTHAELVKRAARWLENTELCSVVLTEVGTYKERVDAIGWKDTERSIVVECKATRGDFRRDRVKPHRMSPELGLGLLRWYLACPGVIPPEELPAGWGLLECYPRQLKRIRQASALPVARTNERSVLLWQLHRARSRLEQSGDLVEVARASGIELDRLRTENARFAQRILELETAKGVLEREVTAARRGDGKGWAFNG